MSHQRLHPARRAAAALLSLSGLAVVSACGLVNSPEPVTAPSTMGAATSSAVHAPSTFDDEQVSGAATPAPMFRVAAPATAVPPTVTVSAVPAPVTTTSTTTAAPRPPSPARPASPAKTTTAPKPAAPKPAAPKPTTPVSAAPAPAAASGPAVTGCGNPNPGKVLLTFDDGGPTAPAILGILDRYGIKARWFPTGEWANGNAAFIARLRAGGQMLGNHTYSHPQMYAALGATELKRQVDQGYHPTTVFRFPYGASDEVSRAVVRSAGYSICGWNIDTNDWKGNSTATITSIVTSQARPGSVVLMHLKFQTDVDALPAIIDNLRGRGLI